VKETRQSRMLILALVTPRLVVIVIHMVMAGVVLGATNDLVLAGVRQGQFKMFRVAADAARTDLISDLQQYAEYPTDPAEPVRLEAKTALAKLGVTKYLNELLLDLISTDSALFQAEKQRCVALYGSDRGLMIARKHVLDGTLDRLSYVKNPATIAYIGPLLYETGDLTPRLLPGVDNDVMQHSAADSAMKALRKMLSHRPDETGAISYGERLHTWQTWWKAHKDYYESIKLISPVSSVESNEVSRPIVTIPTNTIATAVKPPVVPLPPRSPDGKPSERLRWPLLIAVGSLALIAIVTFTILRVRGSKN
jgi:hypothetical protein